MKLLTSIVTGPFDFEEGKSRGRWRAFASNKLRFVYCLFYLSVGRSNRDSFSCSLNIIIK